MLAVPTLNRQQQRADSVVNLIVRASYVLGGISVFMVIGSLLKDGSSASFLGLLPAIFLFTFSYGLSKGQNKGRVAMAVLAVWYAIVFALLGCLSMLAGVVIGYVVLFFLISLPFAYCAYLLFYDVAIREEILRRAVVNDA